MIISLYSEIQKQLTSSPQDLQLILENCKILADLFVVIWDFVSMILIVCSLKMILVIKYY